MSAGMARATCTVSSSSVRLHSDERVVSIDTVVVTTRNRPASLKRCVQSILKNGAEYNRTHSLLVADDSDDPDARRANGAGLAALARQFDAPVRYLGRADRRRFVRALARRTGIDKALLDFAFLPAASGGVSTVGANRNAVLAATTGETVLSSDDDVVWQGAPTPSATSELVLGSVPDPTVIRFFADRRAVEDALQWRTADIAAAHEALLGRSLAELAIRHRGPVRCANWPERLSRAASRARVRVTSLGIAGDSGMWSTRDYIFLRGESQLQSFAHAWSDGRAGPSREVVRAAA